MEASDADLVRLRLTMRPDQAGWRCTVHALHPRFAEPVLCMTADVREGGAAELRQGGDAVLDRALASCRRYVSQARFEEHLARLGFAVDAPFLAVERSWSRDGMTLSRMRRPQVATPAGWESVLLPLLAALPAARFGARHTYAAVGFDSVELAAELPERFWSLATTGAASGPPVAAGASVRGHVLVLGDDGRVVARIKGVTLRRSALGGPTGLDRIPALAAQVRERLTGGRRRTPEQSAPAAAPDQPAYDRPVHGDPAHGDQGRWRRRGSTCRRSRRPCWAWTATRWTSTARCGTRGWTPSWPPGCASTWPPGTTCGYRSAVCWGGERGRSDAGVRAGRRPGVSRDGRGGFGHGESLDYGISFAGL